MSWCVVHMLAADSILSSIRKHETEVLVFVLKFTGESVLPGAYSSKWRYGPEACEAGDEDPLCSLPSQRHAFREKLTSHGSSLSDVILLFGDRTQFSHFTHSCDVITSLKLVSPLLAKGHI